MSFFSFFLLKILSFFYFQFFFFQITFTEMSKVNFYYYKNEICDIKPFVKILLVYFMKIKLLKAPNLLNLNPFAQNKPCSFFFVLF